MTDAPPPPDRPSVAPSTFDPAQRRQRNALIGLAVGSSLVLLIGILAALLTRDDEPAPVTVPTVAPSSAPEPTVASTTTTTEATTTTLPPPVDAVADAGDDLDVDAGSVVTLTAAAVTEGADDDSVRWRQTAGPDVTAGVGALGGRMVSFGAPDDVVTLTFELVVVSGDRAATAPEAVDELIVRVFEDADRALFVDGESGEDAASGSRDEPFRTIGAAARAADGHDLYVRSVGTYVEAGTVRLGPDTSLYGGFDADWFRDRRSQARLEGAAVALLVDGDGDRRIASMQVTGADGAPGERAIGVRVVDAEQVSIHDSTILAGSGGSGTVDAPAGVSVGVVAVRSGELRILRSTVNAASGGDGATATSDGAQTATDGPVGGDGDGRAPGEGGAADGERAGGDGGRGGEAGGTEDAPDGEPGRGGTGGAGGRGGDGGVGMSGDDDRNPLGARGSAGDAGGAGLGGAGGGGGFGPPAVDDGEDLDGGGGGGGGAGGEPSAGGDGGRGGAGSIGVWAVDVNRVIVDESLVAAGVGGSGGAGGPAVAAGDGGAGGTGALGEQGAGDDGGSGGGGAGGGAGGQGGAGGGGAGGPSYGLFTVGVDDVEVRSSTVRAGAGGRGADGGPGGLGGGTGDDGAARNGGDGGESGAAARAEQGAGADGGSSVGWFDVGGARQTLDDAELIEGVAGAGGFGSVTGASGTQAAADVDPE